MVMYALFIHQFYFRGDLSIDWLLEENVGKSSYFQYEYNYWPSVETEGIFSDYSTQPTPPIIIDLCSSLGKLPVGNRIQPNSHWNKNTVKLTLTPRKTADPLVVFPWTACRQLVTASLGHHFARANVPVRAFSKHWLLSSNNINPFRSRTYSICFKNWSFPSLIPPYNGQTLAFSW